MILIDAECVKPEPGDVMLSTAQAKDDWPGVGVAALAGVRFVFTGRGGTPLAVLMPSETPHPAHSYLARKRAEARTPAELAAELERAARAIRKLPQQILNDFRCAMREAMVDLRDLIDDGAQANTVAFNRWREEWRLAHGYGGHGAGRA